MFGTAEHTILCSTKVRQGEAHLHGALFLFGVVLVALEENRKRPGAIRQEALCCDVEAWPRLPFITMSFSERLALMLTMRYFLWHSEILREVRFSSPVAKPTISIRRETILSIIVKAK